MLKKTMPESDAPAIAIGVDGGASKTRVVALAADGRLIGEACGPAATLNGRAETCWDTIVTTLRDIDTLANLALADASIVIGIAGTEIAPAYQAFVNAAPADCGSLAVLSDAHTACAGAHALADGATVAVGTGVVGFCRDQGRSMRAGGWGFPHDDRGSGAWIGMEAVNHALAAADGRSQRDTLANRLLSDFDNDPGALAAWACSARAGDFAHYARVVVDQAQIQCASAEDVLNAAARHISAVARALVGTHDHLALALTGGLATIMESRLDSDLLARLTPAQHDGAYGAALMAQQPHITATEACQ